MMLKKKKREKYMDIGTRMIKEKFGEQVTMSRGDELLWTSCIPWEEAPTAVVEVTQKSVDTFIQKHCISCPIIRNSFSHKFSLDFRLINIPTDLVGFRSDVKIWSHLLQKRFCWIKSTPKVQGPCSCHHLVQTDEQHLIQFCERKVLLWNTALRAILFAASG